jgi:hypothetical protein
MMDSLLIEDTKPPSDIPQAPVPIPDHLGELHYFITCDAMSGHEKGDSSYSVEYWPEKEYKMFYSKNLRRWERSTMAAFFFHNGLDPRLAIDWFRGIGAFDYPHENREAELRAIFTMFNQLARDPCTRPQLAKYRAFDVSKGRVTPLYSPPTEEDIAYRKGYYI